jgi:hypothetical protein
MPEPDPVTVLKLLDMFELFDLFEFEMVLRRARPPAGIIVMLREVDSYAEAEVFARASRQSRKSDVASERRDESVSGERNRPARKASAVEGWKRERRRERAGDEAKCESGGSGMIGRREDDRASRPCSSDDGTVNDSQPTV